MVDLGAGDGRFAQFGRYDQYVGYELDDTKIRSARLPRRAALRHGCVLNATGYFSGAVGNPPFIRNQDLGRLWRRRARELVYRELSVEVDPFSNLYLYFLWLALARTVADGIVGLVVPFDWTYRPSAGPLRDFIRANRWSVDIYRLEGARSHFPDVKTTPSVTIIDKKRPGIQKVWRVLPDLTVRGLDSAGGARVFKYAGRSRIYACRGFSPGSQEVFALTEEERLNADIPTGAVVPCITSLRGLPCNVTTLNESTFRKHFVRAGRKCWLLKTDDDRLPVGVLKWLKAAPHKIKNNTTCGARKTWYQYSTPAAPQLLLGSGFRSAGPRLLQNVVGARNLGSVFGIHGAQRRSDVTLLLERLNEVDFHSGVVADARGFRRIEVGQVNAVLAGIYRHIELQQS